MPADLHSAKSFDNFLSILEIAFGDSEHLRRETIDAPLLFLGLMFREATRAMEIEPGGVTMLPLHLVNSSLGIRQIKKIEHLLDEIPLQILLHH